MSKMLRTTVEVYIKRQAGTVAAAGGGYGGHIASLHLPEHEIAAILGSNLNSMMVPTGDWNTHHAAYNRTLHMMLAGVGVFLAGGVFSAWKCGCFEFHEFKDITKVKIDPRPRGPELSENPLVNLAEKVRVMELTASGLSQEAFLQAIRDEGLLDLVIAQAHARGADELAAELAGTGGAEATEEEEE